MRQSNLLNNPLLHHSLYVQTGCCVSGMWNVYRRIPMLRRLLSVASMFHRRSRLRYRASVEVVSVHSAGNV